VNVWLIAALALLPGVLACLVVCTLARPLASLVALELAGALSSVELLLLAEGTHRQPFVDLALVLSVMAFIGSLAFARLLESGL
jgi:multisubunit Na+/H+ antiporter MnhF subunit